MPCNRHKKDKMDMNPIPKRGKACAHAVEVNVIPPDHTTAFRLLKMRDIVQRILHRTLAEAVQEKTQPSSGNEIEMTTFDQKSS
jgi:hypothetical protein